MDNGTGDTFHSHARAAGANIVQAMKRNPVQFSLVGFFVVCCGATKGFQIFPMPYIAGQSHCRRITDSAPRMDHVFRGVDPNGTMWYKPLEWEVALEGVHCVETNGVFNFKKESLVTTTANLAIFGLVKAFFDFLAVIFCDKFGRKLTLSMGWLLALPMPFMVIFAETWWVAAFSTVFLGIQQALVWSVTIFEVINCMGNNSDESSSSDSKSGESKAGVAIGLHETLRYSMIAVSALISAAIMDVDNPREVSYYVVLALIGVNIIACLLLVVKKDIFKDDETGKKRAANTTVLLPSGRRIEMSAARSAFIHTSFVNTPLISLCYAGLMLNFISGFAWGFFAKWMRNDSGKDYVDGELQWSALSNTAVGGIIFCYAFPKGIFQLPSGIAGDHFGRKWFIVGGLFTCAVGLAVLAIAGGVSSDPTIGFVIGALMLGIGTGIVYTNNLAAVFDHADPASRPFALGSYRFWRDLGWALGALFPSVWADDTGKSSSVWLTAVLTILATVCVLVFYKDFNTPEEEDEKAATSPTVPRIEEV